MPKKLSRVFLDSVENIFIAAWAINISPLEQHIQNCVNIAINDGSMSNLNSFVSFRLELPVPLQYP